MSFVRMKLFSTVALVALISIFCTNLDLVSSAYCNGSPDDGERTSEFPIFDAKELTYVKSIKNAMLFEAGPANATFPIVHLWGNPYELGFAQGTLLKKEMNEFIYGLWAYLITELVDSFPSSNFPDAAKAKVASWAIHTIHTITHYTTL